MFDGIVSHRSRSAVVYRADGAHWRPRFGRSVLCMSLKRAFDVVAASLLLLFLLPAYAVISAAIAPDSPGPILFRQQRTGQHGRIFNIYTVRSMTMAEPGVSASHATRDDARVTRVGRFLRETSLDEVPQLLNVLRGEMALVGPRPHAVEHDRHYAAILPNYDRRFAVRPGLTGLAQIQGLRGEIHDIGSMARRVDADVLYASHWSFPGDLAIMVRTVPLLLARVNAY
jgi:putative colanic acid biosynthesis UDP-glucose lipid carrier transferase